MNRSTVQNAWAMVAMVTLLSGCMGGSAAPEANPQSEVDGQPEVSVKALWSATQTHIEGTTPVIDNLSAADLHQQVTLSVKQAVVESLDAMGVSVTAVPAVNASNLSTARDPAQFREMALFRMTNDQTGCSTEFVSELRTSDPRCTVEVYHGALTRTAVDNGMWAVGANQSLTIKVITPQEVAGMTINLRDQLHDSLPDWLELLTPTITE